MRFKKLTFENERGEKLSARIDFTLKSDPRAYAIFAHCFTCTKNIKAIANISDSLAQKGIAVLRFDFSGLGESEGDFSETNFSSNVSDLVAASGFLEKNYKAPNLLIGHSFGGTACLKAAINIPSVAAVATIGSPADPLHVEHLLGQATDQIRKTGEAELLLAGRPFKIKKQFIDDLGQAKIEKILPRLNRALLILHSPVDEIVSIENAGYLYETARHPKSFISLDKADHMMSNPLDSRYVGNMIAEWSSRYIEAPEKKTT